MAAVVGYLVVVTIAIVAALRVAGPRRVIERDPTFELEDVAARHAPSLALSRASR